FEGRLAGAAVHAGTVSDVRVPWGARTRSLLSRAAPWMGCSVPTRSTPHRWIVLHGPRLQRRPSRLSRGDRRERHAVVRSATGTNRHTATPVVSVPGTETTWRQPRVVFVPGTNTTPSAERVGF